MMANLGLAQLTAIDVSSVEFVSIAAAAGVDSVSLFICQVNPKSQFPLTTLDNFTAVQERLNDGGLQVANVESFVLTPDVDIGNYRSAIELGAELGAQRATTLLYDPDETRVIDNLSRMCELTGEYGLGLGIEFMPFTPGWKNLKQVVALINQVAKPGIRVGIDLLHLIRSGGTIADVTSTDPQLIGYAQLCDSEDTSANESYFEEAGARRLAPGEGKFPVQEFLRALPAGTLLELEVPQPADIPASERIKLIVEAARQQVDQTT